VKDVYFGHEVTDPYRWMEAESDELSTWMKGQADFARAALDKVTALGALRARVKELDNAAARVSLPARAGEELFYTKAETGTDTYKLYTRHGVAGAERVLLDPDKLAEPGRHASIDYWQPSRDGRYIAFGVSQSGSEMAVLHVAETASGRVLPDAIDRARLSHPSWVDATSFLYRRNRKLPPDAPPNERFIRARVYLHKLGADPETDVAVFGHGVSPSIAFADQDFPSVDATKDQYLIAMSDHGVQPELTLYAAKKSELRGDKTPWRKIVDVPDAVTDYAVHGDDLYVLTHKGAPRFKVLKTRLGAPDLAKATTVVPESELVLQDIRAASDGLYVRGLEKGLGRLSRLGYEASAKLERIEVPGGASVRFFSAKQELPGVLLSAASWTTAPITYLFEAKTKQLSDTGIAPKSPVVFANIVAEEVEAKSADGTNVPLSILHAKDLAKDGSHPTLLRGYGAYGNVWEPSFEPMDLAWLERGGVLAVCHARGGGEYGDAWHKAGQLATKPNTVADFLGCGHHLVDQGFTSPARLAGEGRSAGGILIGGAITKEPALFGAALIRVGMTNALRFEQIPIGPFNIDEFGTVKTPEGFDMLWAIDAYHHVQDKTAYPAVMLMTGATDSRVSPWQAAKMAARLQVATSSGRPVLLRVSFEAGHGIGSSRSQIEEENADIFAFLVSALGKN
jgi:prolyl oligopeptidase